MLSACCTEIIGIYNFGYGWEDLTFVEARRQRKALRDKFSSFDEIDYGYIHFRRAGELVAAIQPVSLSGFVWWASANAAEFAEGGTIWLSLLEEDALFLCKQTEITIQVRPGI